MISALFEWFALGLLLGAVAVAAAGLISPEMFGGIVAVSAVSWGFSGLFEERS